MNLVNTVFEISEKFMIDPKYVTVNYNKIDYVAGVLKSETPPKFPDQLDKDDIFKSCLLELIGDSINYCYWYGRSSIRPLDAGSGKMYKIIETAFEKFDRNGGINSIDRCLDEVIKYLSIERFPLLEERIKHLDELRYTAQNFIEEIITREFTFEHYLQNLIQRFPGYASDMFLKRAFLFFAQLNRMYGWFEDEMKDLPIPADYQVPKMLDYYSIIKYSPELKTIIKNEKQIPKGSLFECEIRAASIIACRQLGNQLNWSMPQIDGYFWLSRKEVTGPFHLTVTSDY